MGAVVGLHVNCIISILGLLWLLSFLRTLTFGGREVTPDSEIDKRDWVGGVNNGGWELGKSERGYVPVGLSTYFPSICAQTFC